MAKDIRLAIKVDSKTGVAKIKNVSKSMKGMEKQTIKSSKSMTKSLGSVKSMLIAIGSVVIFKQIVDGFKSITKVASDYQETTSKFEAIFREQTVEAQKMADVLVTEYGRSRDAAQEFLAIIQDTLVPLGANRTEALRLSDAAAKLAIDMGSLYNIPAVKVLGDIQSAMVGNGEVMKQYSTIINETTLVQEALNKGWISSKKEITPLIKAQAALSLTTKSAAAALGDFDRTSDGYANTLVVFKNRIRDLKAFLGKPLLKVFTPIIKNMTLWIEANEDLIATEFKEWVEKVRDAAGILAKNIDLIVIGVTSLIALKLASWFYGVAASIISVQVAFAGVGFFKWVKSLATVAASASSFSGALRIVGNTAKLTLPWVTKLGSALLLISPVAAGVGIGLITDKLVEMAGGAKAARSELDILYERIYYHQEIINETSWLKYINGTGNSIKELERLKIKLQEVLKYQRLLDHEASKIGSGDLEEDEPAWIPGKPRPKKDDKSSIDYDKEVTKMKMDLRNLDFQDYINKESDKIKKAGEFAEAAKTLSKEQYEAMWATRLEYAQKDLSVVEEFNENYKQATMSSYAYEITLIDAQAEVYKKAGANKVAVNKWVAGEIKKIDDKSLEDSKGALQTWVDSYKDEMEQLEDIVVSAAESFSSGLTDAIFDADVSFKDFARNFLREIAKMIVQTTILNALKGGGGGWFRALITSAKGNVFNQSGLQAFAAGGIVNSPTIFPFAGGTGLMGEAGPEAILPLKRGPSGNLGVESSGNNNQGKTTIIYNNVTAMDSQSVADVLRRNPGAIVSVVNEQIQRGNSVLNGNIKRASR